MARLLVVRLLVGNLPGEESPLPAEEEGGCASRTAGAAEITHFWVFLAVGQIVELNQIVPQLHFPAKLVMLASRVPPAL